MFSIRYNKDKLLRSTFVDINAIYQCRSPHVADNGHDDTLLPHSKTTKHG
jgi:hypothetical protein